MGKAIILWLLGVPLTLLVVLWHSVSFDKTARRGPDSGIGAL
jgi:hypothetical protein